MQLWHCCYIVRDFLASGLDDPIGGAFPSGSSYMTASRTTLTTVAAALLLALLSGLSLWTGVPTVMSPLNMLLLVPGLLSSCVLGKGWFVASIAFIPVTFWLWCRPVLRGSQIVPSRSLFLLGGSVALSAFWFVAGIEYGLTYQGRDYVVGTAAVSVAWWATLAGLALAAWRFPRPGLNVTFHIALFAWLAWYAFPYLGELP
jgi:hypothetical protein